MKYEEIKVGDVFRYIDDKETVISKSDKYRIITTIDSETIPTTWAEESLHFLEPIKEELPEEGLVVSGAGSLVYKLSNGSGYGFPFGNQSHYSFGEGWSFDDNYWKPATPEQEKKFIGMLKKECEKHGLYEDTKIEKHADGGALRNSDYMGVQPRFSSTECFNKNGKIFFRGKFATPRKEEQLPEEGLLVSKLGAIVYRTGKKSGYGFNRDKDYKNHDGGYVGWTFNSIPEDWRKATEQEEEKFVEMLWGEWVKMGNDEDTKIECHAKVSLPKDRLNLGDCNWESTYQTLWNKNGCIFHRGEFATPLKEEETTLEIVSNAYLDLSKFRVEIEQDGDMLMINPIKKVK